MAGRQQSVVEEQPPDAGEKKDRGSGERGTGPERVRDSQAVSQSSRDAETSARALLAAYQTFGETALPFVPFAPIFSAFL